MNEWFCIVCNPFCTVCINIGIDAQFTAMIVSNPAGTPDVIATDYPILSNVTLTCMVTSSEGATFTVDAYQWETTGCFTNVAHSTPTCFPISQTTQSVISNSLLAEDASVIRCTATISGVDYTSGPLTLRVSGKHLLTYVSICPCVSMWYF